MTTKNNNFHILLSITLGLVLIAGMASPALAQKVPNGPVGTTGPLTTNVVPDHTEVGDAGDLPSTAQAPGGQGDFDSISGSSTNDGLDVDMFEMCISDTSLFGAEVTQADFDTQLFLFDSTGLLVDSDDDGGVDLGESLLGIGDQTGEPAGTYYLAISTFNTDPNDDPITNWDEDPIDFFGLGFGGDYFINLSGAASCQLVGGELLPINTTALILAGAQTNAVWIMSALAVIGSIAFGALYITSKKN